MARATSSLPVPVSPVIRTVLRVAATCSTRRITSAIARLCPTSPYWSSRGPIAVDERASLQRPLAHFTTVLLMPDAVLQPIGLPYLLEHHGDEGKHLVGGLEPCGAV